MLDPVPAVTAEGLTFGGWQVGQGGWQISTVTVRDNVKYVAAKKTTLVDELVFIYDTFAGGCSVDPTPETSRSNDREVYFDAASAIAALVQAGRLR